MKRLDGKCALITGGASGIGLATARRFLDEGARVAITGSNLDRLELAKAELGDVLTICSDAADANAQAALAATIQDAFGKLDILFVNAGVADYCSLAEVDEAAFDRAVATNLKGPIFLIQALLPIFANPSSVILNGSINAHLGVANAIVYSATKAAIISVARTLSAEAINRGIRANVISPGPIDTPIFDKIAASAAHREEIKLRLSKKIPVGRFGSPYEVADAAVYLASDESRYTVGSEITVDGGLSIV